MVPAFLWLGWRLARGSGTDLPQSDVFRAVGVKNRVRFYPIRPIMRWLG